MCSSDLHSHTPYSLCIRTHKHTQGPAHTYLCKHADTHTHLYTHAPTHTLHLSQMAPDKKPLKEMSEVIKRPLKARGGRRERGKGGGEGVPVEEERTYTALVDSTGS